MPVPGSVRGSVRSAVTVSAVLAVMVAQIVTRFLSFAVQALRVNGACGQYTSGTSCESRCWSNDADARP